MKQSDSVEDTTLKMLSDKLALSELMMRYCRGMDRNDWPMLRDVFHGDAVVDFGTMYRGPATKFIDLLPGFRSASDRESHSIANMLFVVLGDKAEGESSFFSDGQRRPPLSEHHHIGGRYIDHFERRDGVWRISKHMAVCDFVVILPLSDHSRAAVNGWGMASGTTNDITHREIPSIAALRSA